MEEFTDARIATELCTATARHVRVRVVLANRSHSQSGDKAIHTLKHCGAEVAELGSPYVHAKAIVVDASKIYVGSANLSPTSLDRNRELGVITKIKAVVGQVATTVSADIAAASPL